MLEAANLNGSQNEIYICSAGDFLVANLKLGVAAAFDFFPTVDQIGEKAVHFPSHCSLGSQAQCARPFLANPALVGLVSVEVWTVAWQVH